MLTIKKSVIRKTYSASVIFNDGLKFPFLEHEQSAMLNQLFIERLEHSLRSTRTKLEHWDTVMDGIDLKLSIKNLSRNDLGIDSDAFKTAFNDVFKEIELKA
jgi:hypothetical protein